MSGAPRQGGHGQDPWMWRELRRPVPAPDLTGPVLKRLGLGGLTAQQAARRRAMRSAARVAICVAVVGGGALVARTWTELSRAQPVPGPTIPSAIRHDLEHFEHHSRTIGEAIRTIQELGGTQAARGEPEAAPPGGDAPPEEAPPQPRV